MKVINKKNTIALDPVPSTNIIEYPSSDKYLSGAVAKINGRYPESGYVLNQKSKEIAYVIEGYGQIVTPDKTWSFSEGDELIVDANEKYYWQGKFTIYMVNSPAFNPKQHIIIN